MPILGRRVFTAGHSFHVFVAQLLPDLARSAGINGHVAVGTQYLGGSRVLEHGVRTFALDAPNLDETRFDRAPADGFASHRLIAAVDGAIVENLCGLDSLDSGPYLLSVLPLRLTDADGAPCRAVALLL